MSSLTFLDEPFRACLRFFAVGVALGCSSAGDASDASPSSPDVIPVHDAPLDGDATDAVDSDEADTGIVDGPCRPRLSAGGLELDCALVRVTLTPFVVVDGTKEVGACSRDASRDGPLRCEVASGVLEVAATSPWTASFVPTGAGTLTQIGFTGSASVPGARAFLSNGFQSWSMSGAVALREPLSAQAIEEAFAQRGDAETLRSGEAFSWWWSVVGGGGPALVAGVTAASHWKS